MPRLCHFPPPGEPLGLKWHKRGIKVAYCLFHDSYELVEWDTRDCICLLYATFFFECLFYASFMPLFTTLPTQFLCLFYASYMPLYFMCSSFRRLCLFYASFVPLLSTFVPLMPHMPQICQFWTKRGVNWSNMPLICQF